MHIQFTFLLRKIYASYHYGEPTPASAPAKLMISRPCFSCGKLQIAHSETRVILQAKQAGHRTQKCKISHK